MQVSIATCCGMQVTNPPIDPLREGLVMSLGMRLGARGNLLQPGAEAYRQIVLDSPVMLESDLEAVLKQGQVKTQVRAAACSASFPLHFARMMRMHDAHATYAARCCRLCRRSSRRESRAASTRR